MPMVSGIPSKIRNQIDSLPFYKVCAKAHLKGHECQGRITMEHAVEFAGKRLNELWAIIPLCEYGHSVDKHQDGGDLNKEINLWIALSRASGSELTAISKAVDYKREKSRLMQVYGVYREEDAIAAYTAKTAGKGAILQKPVEEKKHWYLVTPEMREKIDICREFYEGFGLSYTPNDIIDLAILEYYEETLKSQHDND